MTIRCDDTLLLGLDGGCTKTDALLCSGDGRVISRASGGASGFSGIPEEEAHKNLTYVLTQVLEPVGGLGARLSGIFAGISGCGLPAVKLHYQAYLEKTLPGAANIRTGSDIINALNTAPDPDKSIIAVAGTGSCVCYRENGELKNLPIGKGD